MKYTYLLLICICLAIPASITSQESVDFDISYELNKTYPSFAVSKNDIAKFTTIEDLNRFYKSSWIAEFVSVKMTSIVKGKEVIVNSKSDVLTKEQKALIRNSDNGATISIDIEYIPNNTLTSNDIHLFDFTFAVEPENDATFPGGLDAMNQYLKTNLTDKISAEIYNQYQLTVFKFSVNKDGIVVNPEIIESSKDESTDALILEAIRKMPCWIPASYGDGAKTEQSFALTAGDHNSCNINLVNIKKDWPREN